MKKARVIAVFLASLPAVARSQDLAALAELLSQEQ